MRFVLGASVALSWLLRDVEAPEASYAFAVLKAVRTGGFTASVPMTWGLEIANVLARAERKDQVTEAQSESFIEMLRAMRIEADSATFTQALTDTLQLARRHRLSSYDASYLELALRAGLPLATLDEELRRAAQRAGVSHLMAT
ncbi:MAG TPA: type II toxin-antitoxin system VapC family toxin [Steroidobacteraceae bacterium]